MQWIIDDLQTQLDFFKYRIIHGLQTESLIKESKAKANDLELAIKTLQKANK